MSWSQSVVPMVSVTVPASSADEVVDLVGALIRFDTSNTGDPATTKGEAECARWVAEQLQEVGYDDRIRRGRGARPGQPVRPVARVPTPRAAP